MKLIFCAIALAITSTFASKLISIPFTAVDRKSLSAASTGKKKQGSAVSAPLENVDLAYLIDVNIGTPPQKFTLLLDTGSSSSWVPLWGCGFFCGLPKHAYLPLISSTFSPLDIQFDIKYGEGFAKGFYAKDTMIVNGISVPNVSFAVSNINDGELTENGADGILAIGPDRLSMHNNPNKKVVPTLVTTMHENGIIDDNMFSVYFQPVNHSIKGQERRINGEIVFGGVQEHQIIGEVDYVSVTSNKKFSDYWAADIDKITVGEHPFLYEKKLVAMVDTGSTLIFLPKPVISNVFRGVRGLRQDRTGQYLVPCHAGNLPNITIEMDSHNFTISPENYVITTGPLVYSTKLCYTYLQESPNFVDAILGYGFLQKYVSVYDNGQKRIGLAQRATL